VVYKQADVSLRTTYCNSMHVFGTVKTQALKLKLNFPGGLRNLHLFSQHFLSCLGNSRKRRRKLHLLNLRAILRFRLALYKIIRWSQNKSLWPPLASHQISGLVHQLKTPLTMAVMSFEDSLRDLIGIYPSH
jgi:hypothetical protein